MRKRGSSRGRTSRPDGATLRKLAATLLTTPAALLGAGAQVPPGQVRPVRPPVITKLMPTECRRLIASGGIGRLAFGTASGPVVVPVNFAVVAGTIVLRTGKGTIIDGHADDQVAFEIDHLDEALCQGWSVLVRGPAHRVARRPTVGRPRWIAVYSCLPTRAAKSASLQA